MLALDITCWFFTESRFREANPFKRFEVEMLDELENIARDCSQDRKIELRMLILKRSDEIFESDLSWGQNIYSRENLRWCSFLAGCMLTIQENVDEPAPYMDGLERKILKYGSIRWMALWIPIAKFMIFLQRKYPRTSIVRRFSICRLLRYSYLPFTSRSKWLADQDEFYRRFCTAHACPELNEMLGRTSARWKRYVPDGAIS